MDRKDFLLRKRFHYMLILFVVFLVIMSTLSIIVHTAAESALYEDLSNQMLNADAAIHKNIDGAVENFLNGSNIVYTDTGGYVITYRIFLLLRNEDGEILNAEYLTAFDYMMNINFSKNSDGKFRTERVERNSSTLYYRTFTRQITTSDGRIFYIQMANDTTEIEVSLSIIQRVLIQCTCLVMLLVVIIGWYLSKALVGGVEEAWEKQDEFISYASHELRTPLAVIHSSMELLLETPGQKIIERSDLILHSLVETSRLRKMSSNLLEMVQLQASEMTLHVEVIDTEQMISEFIEPFCYQAEAAGKRLEYQLEPGFLYHGDKQLLTELLAILLENALKYTQTGDYIRLISREHEGKFILKVSDSGVGISDEALDKIFTRFYRDKRQQSKSDGSGLGLYIANLIVARHGGKLVAEHNKPKGTVFTVSLPIKRKK